MDLMENAKDERFISEKKLPSTYVKQIDFAQMGDQQQAFTKTNAKMKLKTLRFNPSSDSNINSDHTYLNCKEFKDESMQVCENKDLCHTTDAFMEGDRKNESKVLAQTVPNKAKKKVLGKKEKKNMVLIDKKENLKKISNSGKTMKQKVSTKRTNKASSGSSSLNKYCKHTDNELMQNCTKFDLLQRDKRYFDKHSLPSFTCIKSNADNILDTNFCYGISKQQQELSQYSLENNRNVLQYLDYNNLRQVSQQTMPVNPNPWLMESRNGQNVLLTNTVTNIGNEEQPNRFINNKQHQVYSTNYNWNQNENLYTNCSMDSINPYKLYSSEYKTYCLCNLVHSPNCMWNNAYVGIEEYPRTSTAFQPTTSISSNYVMSTTASNSFLNPMAAPFSPFHHYQPSPTDIRKLYYTNLNTVNYANNNGYELMVKENMSSYDIWHQENSMAISNNNNLNVSHSAPMTPWPDTTYPFYTDSGNVYVNNYYSKNTERANVYKNQYKERSNLVSCTGFENVLLETHELEPHKTDNETTVLSHENNMATNTNYIMSDITDLLSGTDAVTYEMLTPCIYDEKK